MLRKDDKLPPLEYLSVWDRFLRYETGSAILLAAAAALAIVIANTPVLSAWYFRFWNEELGIHCGGIGFVLPLRLWVNDALMAMFFFLVGLEIKYEVLAGHLTSLRTAMLPVVGALGGMLVPACIYVTMNVFWGGGDAMERLMGWGIPMSTDIAFAVGCIGLVSRHVPPALRVFLVTLAIADDVGAVIVIATFYTDTLALEYLAAGLVLVAIAYALGRMGVHSALLFFAYGGIVWFCFLLSGVHATIGGVLMAFAIPMQGRYRTHLFHDRTRELLARFTEAENAATPLLVNNRQQGVVRSVTRECFYVESTLQRTMHNLEPFCLLLILPLFAFANSGIQLDFGNIPELLFRPVTLGVLFGLLIGKQAGVSLFAWLFSKLGVTRLPEGVQFRQLYALSWVAGIGFTMALFVSELAFTSGEHFTPLTFRSEPSAVHADSGGERGKDAPATAHADSGGDRGKDAPATAHAEVTAEEGQGASKPPPYNDEAKVGIFLASILSAIIGIVLLKIMSPPIYTDNGKNGHEGPPGEAAAIQYEI